MMQINYLIYNLRLNLKELHKQNLNEKQNMALKAIETHLNILDQTVNIDVTTEAILLEKKPERGLEIYITTVETEHGTFLQLKQHLLQKKQLQIEDLVKTLV